MAAEVWSATSYKLLAEDALSTERWNRLHPTEPARVPYVTEQLDAGEGPVVAVTDFIKGLAEQIGRFVPAPFVPLGTDGFGWSDTRDALRRHFEVDAEHIAVAVLASMARSGDLKSEVVADAIRRFDIDPEASDPRYTDGRPPVRGPRAGPGGGGSASGLRSGHRRRVVVEVVVGFVGVGARGVVVESARVPPPSRNRRRPNPA